MIDTDHERRWGDGRIGDSHPSPGHPHHYAI